VFLSRTALGSGMSVAEPIKKVKALPAREREKVFLAILALDEEAPPPIRSNPNAGPGLTLKRERNESSVIASCRI
jgi:hypothetical protein